MHHQTEIKTIVGKIGFLKFIWKLESSRLFENWSFRDYLKIGFLEVKCRNENFQKLNLKEIGTSRFIRELDIYKLNLRIGISETKFERNWSFENYLRVWDLKKKIKLRKLGLWKLNFERNQNWKLFEKWSKFSIVPKHLAFLRSNFGQEKLEKVSLRLL